jgi:hypothetical protein
VAAISLDERQIQVRIGKSIHKQGFWIPQDGQRIAHVNIQKGANGGQLLAQVPE